MPLLVFALDNSARLPDCRPPAASAHLGRQRRAAQPGCQVAVRRSQRCRALPAVAPAPETRQCPPPPVRRRHQPRRSAPAPLPARQVGVGGTPRASCQTPAGFARLLPCLQRAISPGITAMQTLLPIRCCWPPASQNVAAGVRQMHTNPSRRFDHCALQPGFQTPSPTRTRMSRGGACAAMDASEAERLPPSPSDPALGQV